MIRLSRSFAQTALLFSAFSAGVAMLAGCGEGNIAATNSSSTYVAGFSGTIHGGPNPAIGARVVIYATGASQAGGPTADTYGVGQALQTTTSGNYGQFAFPGGFTCPANEMAYIVAYGGNTGGNANNPNSIMMTALGPCSSLYTGTVYTGGGVFINEATTVAAGYALANFMTITGNSVAGYTVGIGAPPSNNAATPCVSTSTYYTGCASTATAGLRHAFANAAALVNTGTGVINASTTNGASIPAPLIATIANIVQSCVNSNGGGTNTTTGAPTTTTTATGTSHDGTACGKLFAFSSYTNNGTATGTLTAAGNTLDAVKNLAKRPTGTASTFDASCDPNFNTAGSAIATGTGTTTAVSCLSILSGTTNFYQPQLTVTPPDFTLGISYPKGGLSNSTTNLFTAANGCASTTTTNGLFYPAFVATDINDDAVILNTDQSTPKCGNVIAVGPDGTVLGASTPSSTSAAPNFASVLTLTLDSYGHAIVPVKGANGVLFFQYNAGGTANANDANVPLVLTVTSPTTTGTTTTTSAYEGNYAQVDGSSNVYVAAANAVNTYGVLTPTTLSHTAPAYGTVSIGATTSTLQEVTIDPNGNAFTTKSTGPIGNAAFTTTPPTTFISGPASGVTNSAIIALTVDSQIDNGGTGNIWQALNNGATPNQTVILKYPYTVAAGALAFGTASTTAAPTYAFPTTTTDNYNGVALSTSPKYAIMDGSNVMWFGDFAGTSGPPTVGSFLRGYDTVNNYGTNQLQGCKVTPTGTFAITSYTVGATSTTFTLSATSTISVNAILTLSGFTTSTFLNGQVVTVSASAAGSFTVNSTFGQASGTTATEAGVATSRTGTTCGSSSGDPSYPSTTPYLFYTVRGIAVDSMGNIWTVDGTQGTANETIGLGNPTLPTYIHNGASFRP